MHLYSRDANPAWAVAVLFLTLSLRLNGRLVEVVGVANELVRVVGRPVDSGDTGVLRRLVEDARAERAKARVGLRVLLRVPLRRARVEDLGVVGQPLRRRDGCRGVVREHLLVHPDRRRRVGKRVDRSLGDATSQLFEDDLMARQVALADNETGSD